MHHKNFDPVGVLKRLFHLLIIVLCCIGIGENSAAAATFGDGNGNVTVAVDFPAFLARQDLVFNELPDRFDHGAFLGNGFLGTTIYQTGDETLRFEMGRTDVIEQRRDYSRIPIGGLVLKTVGRIETGTMRLDLWNAEVRGHVLTDRGELRFRALIHTSETVLVIDLDTQGEESGAKFSWDSAPCVDFVNWNDAKKTNKYGDPENPPVRYETIEGVPVAVQELYGHGMYAPDHGGGAFATAWKEVSTEQTRRVFLSIAVSCPEITSPPQAVETVLANAQADFENLLASHRQWWNDFYPKSFVSVPDSQTESFYWIQWYKLASASRPDGPVVDLLGPWFRHTCWPRVWWNLNVQTLYLPVYTGNRLELGESLVNFFDKNRENFYRNGRDMLKTEGVATVSHTTDMYGRKGDGTCAPDKYINPSDFIWGLHDYYLHYRMAMDSEYITNHEKHAFYPLLRDGFTAYLNILEKGDDGKYHLPSMMSPEYQFDVDTNYQMALVRWGGTTLLELNERYQINDPLAVRWRDVLDYLPDFAADDATGLKIGPNVQLTESHRHWSHMLMIHPLHIWPTDWSENSAQMQLLEKSVQHWLTVGNRQQIYSWSSAAAASLWATVGNGDSAFEQIKKHMNNPAFVQPNTQYIEGSPVIECSIVLNCSIQDLLLQSRGGVIRVFPAIPKNEKRWENAIFHNLRAEGAFLISAERRHGKTAWLRVKSLAGEPCLIQTDLPVSPTVYVNGNRSQNSVLKPKENGMYELAIGKGDEVLICATPDTKAVVAPLPHENEPVNPWGVKRSFNTQRKNAVLMLATCLPTAVNVKKNLPFTGSLVK